MPETTPVAPSQPALPAQSSDAGKQSPANVSAAQFSQFLNRTPEPVVTPEAPTTEAPVAPVEPAPEVPVQEVMETPAEPTEDAENALSQSTSLSPEQQEAINRRIGKITAKRKEAEREAEALRLEIAQLRAQPAPEVPSVPLPHNAPPLANITTVAGLQKMHEDAKGAVRWAEEQLDRDDLGEGLQVGDKILTKADLKAIVRNAKVTLEDQIPARHSFLVAQHQATQKAFEIYPELRDTASPEYHAAMQAYREQPWLHNLPNSALIVGRMILGTKAEQERLKAKTAPAPKVVPKARPSADQAAVSASGSATRSVGTQNKTAIQQEKTKLEAKGGVSTKDYAAFLSRTEQLRQTS